MKTKMVNFDLGMIIGICIIASLIITASVARIAYGPNSQAEESLEDFIRNRYGIEVEFSPDDKTEYEIIIDEYTGKRIIREKKLQLENNEASHVPVRSFDYFPTHTSFCSR